MIRSRNERGNCRANRTGPTANARGSTEGTRREPLAECEGLQKKEQIKTNQGLRRLGTQGNTLEHLT